MNLCHGKLVCVFSKIIFKILKYGKTKLWLVVDLNYYPVLIGLNYLLSTYLSELIKHSHPGCNLANV